MSLLTRRKKRPLARDAFAHGGELSGPIVHDWTDRAITQLGTIKRGTRETTYVLLGSQEYRVGFESTSDLGPAHYMKTGEPDLFRRMVPVPTGAYHALALAQSGDQPAKPAHAVDVLATLPALRGRADWFAPVPAAPQAADATVVTGPMTDVKPHGFVAGRPRITTFRGALELYEAKAELSVVGDRLLVRDRNLSANDWDALRALAPYLAAILAGAPMPCAFDHVEPVEAVTLLAIDVPSCAEHAAW